MAKLEARMSYHLDLSPEEFRLITKALRVCAELSKESIALADMPEGFPDESMQESMSHLQQFFFDVREKQTNHLAKQFTAKEVK